MNQPSMLTQVKAESRIKNQVDKLNRSEAATTIHDSYFLLRRLKGVS